MRIVLILLISAWLCLSIFAQKAGQKQESTPVLVSFSDLKWVELAERQGMQFAVLSGDPKSGPYRGIRKSRRELTTRSIHTAAKSRT